MKTLAVVLFSFVLGSFSPDHKLAPLPHKSIKPFSINQVPKAACRVLFLLNPSTTDSAQVEVQSCDGITSTISLQPQAYTTTDCLSTDYGVVILDGNVIVDWMQICP